MKGLWIAFFFFNVLLVAEISLLPNELGPICWTCYDFWVTDTTYNVVCLMSFARVLDA